MNKENLKYCSYIKKIDKNLGVFVKNNFEKIFPGSKKF